VTTIQTYGREGQTEIGKGSNGTDSEGFQTMTMKKGPGVGGWMTLSNLSWFGGVPAYRGFGAGEIT